MNPTSPNHALQRTGAAVTPVAELGVVRRCSRHPPMMTKEYPSEIPGLRFIAHKDFPAWAPSSDFQTTSVCDSESARLLLTLLPADLQICYPDPDRDRDISSELTYVFIRRIDDRFFEQIGRHGYLSGWSEVPYERVLSSFASSQLVRSPIADFASFHVQTIPEHQRHEHRANTRNA